MCGRYTITVSLEQLLLRFYIDGNKTPYNQPRYNVAPGQVIPAIIHDGERNRLGGLRWGLVPSWAKDERTAFQMINARSETLLEKPAYRIPFERKRCLIPADGFYEWRKIGSGKQPMRMTLKSGALFAMAGLYDTWINPVDGSKLSTCTIVTTTPNELLADIHDRMPVIIRKEDESLWLSQTGHNSDGTPDLSAILALLRPYPAEEMLAYPVSLKVGNVRNDDPSLIEEFGMGTLF